MADDQEPHFQTVMHGTIAIATRTTRRYESDAEMASAFALVVAWLGQQPDHLGLVVDLRKAIGRNDAAFEEAIKPHRQAMFRAAKRNVVVVQTAAGALQVRRHLAGDGIEAEVVTDLDHALAILHKSLEPG